MRFVLALGLAILVVGCRPPEPITLDGRAEKHFVLTDGRTVVCIDWGGVDCDWAHAK